MSNNTLVSPPKSIYNRLNEYLLNIYYSYILKPWFYAISSALDPNLKSVISIIVQVLLVIFLSFGLVIDYGLISLIISYILSITIVSLGVTMTNTIIVNRVSGWSKRPLNNMIFLFPALILKLSTYMIGLVLLYTANNYLLHSQIVNYISLFGLPLFSLYFMIKIIKSEF